MLFRSPCCVNPQHLTIGDLHLRNHVMVANGHAGRGRRGFTVNGQPIVPKKQNRQYKYTDEQMIRIRNQPSEVTAGQFGWTREKASKMRWEFRKNYRWLPPVEE